MSRKALFAGSFDPFTTGHEDIVRRSLRIADEVLVGIGVNEGKRCLLSSQERLDMICALYQDEPRVSVYLYDGLTTDFALSQGVDFLIRGVRSAADMELEQTLAETNRRLSGMETILLLNSPELRCVSSSAVRELMHFGKDISGWVPDIIRNAIINKRSFQ